MKQLYNSRVRIRSGRATDALHYTEIRCDSQTPTDVDIAVSLSSKRNGRISCFKSQFVHPKDIHKKEAPVPIRQEGHYLEIVCEMLVLTVYLELETIVLSFTLQPSFGRLSSLMFSCSFQSSTKRVDVKLFYRQIKLQS